ncbi:hypothetical protein G6F43_011837 [Rhizopus delemar]|nr:hypothetical protein G6F43_011837 [Rhizopus delemar]
MRQIIYQYRCHKCPTDASIKLLADRPKLRRHLQSVHHVVLPGSKPGNRNKPDILDGDGPPVIMYCCPSCDLDFELFDEMKIHLEEFHYATKNTNSVVMEGTMQIRNKNQSSSSYDDKFMVQGSDGSDSCSYPISMNDNSIECTTSRSIVDLNNQHVVRTDIGACLDRKLIIPPAQNDRYIVKGFDVSNAFEVF